MVESDPWLTGSTYPPNFYYRQQDELRSAASGKSWDWVVTYPNDVIGFAKGNYMNLATSLGIYTAVTKELGQDLVFPGSEAFYTKFDSFTYSKLHASFCVWAALEEKAGNQAFNVVNGDVESWQNMWLRLAKRYGLKVKEDQFEGEAPLRSETKLREKPPLVEFEKEAGLVGQVKQSAVEQRIDLVKWSKEEDVKNAWQKVAKREGLEEDAFEKATWQFLGFVLGRNFDLVISMSKAREYGWTG